ncbi:hypothetical protein SMC26_45945 [Actinomadura fulvescens]|uniref:Uncharacterized protein n=1 Tax=Actinomadura fulvescens TaxID=46160 RepID=A0ABN3R135_9ACTN
MKARSSVLTGGLALTMTLGLAVQPSPAHALGDNRSVSRPCGSNWVASGASSSGTWAETQKESGTCAGRLSAGLQFNDGMRIRNYGSNSHARIYRSMHTFRYGLHWGCDACDVTVS